MTYETCYKSTSHKFSLNAWGRAANERESDEVLRSTSFAWMGLNHMVNSRGGKNDWHMLCRERCEMSLTVLLVNCHDVTGRIFDRWISRQAGMKSLLKGHNQPGKKDKGLLESPVTYIQYIVAETCVHVNWGINYLDGEWITPRSARFLTWPTWMIL